jgi:hypothetical protein
MRKIFFSFLSVWPFRLATSKKKTRLARRKVETNPPPPPWRGYWHFLFIPATIYTPARLITFQYLSALFVFKGNVHWKKRKTGFVKQFLKIAVRKRIFLENFSIYLVSQHTGTDNIVLQHNCVDP